MTDLQKIRELQGKVMKDIAAGALIPIMMIGDELNLFEKLWIASSLNTTVEIELYISILFSSCCR